MVYVKFKGVVFAALFGLTACGSTASKPLLTGDITSENLLADYTTFSSAYQSYQLSDADTKTIKSWSKSLQVDVYFGTWCHDSEREVPRLLKIASLNPNLSIRLIGLDYHKSEPSGSAKANGVRFTPTFIVKNQHHEIGRIIERPKQNLVADIDAMHSAL